MIIYQSIRYPQFFYRAGDCGAVEALQASGNWVTTPYTPNEELTASGEYRRCDKSHLTMLCYDDWFFYQGYYQGTLPAQEDYSWYQYNLLELIELI